MAFSSYQVQRLLQKLRRFFRVDAHITAAESDPVRLSRPAREMSRQAGRLRAPRPPRAVHPETLGEREGYSQVVERERERRAESFLPGPLRPPAPSTAAAKSRARGRTRSAPNVRVDGD